MKTSFATQKEILLKTEFRQELTNILNWWGSHTVDEEHGGFYGRIDGHGKLYPEADKGKASSSMPASTCWRLTPIFTG